MGKVLFWLVWIVELLLFLFGAGCVVVLMSMGSMSDGAAVLMVLLLLATVALCGFGLVKALRAANAGADRGKVALYLSLPVLAAFLFTGTCLIMVR